MSHSTPPAAAGASARRTPIATAALARAARQAAGAHRPGHLGPNGNFAPAPALIPFRSGH